jgi:hypothetical protein
VHKLQWLACFAKRVTGNLWTACCLLQTLGLPFVWHCVAARYTNDQCLPSSWLQACSRILGVGNHAVNCYTQRKEQLVTSQGPSFNQPRRSKPACAPHNACNCADAHPQARQAYTPPMPAAFEKSTPPVPFLPPSVSPTLPTKSPTLLHSHTHNSTARC